MTLQAPLLTKRNPNTTKMKHTLPKLYKKLLILTLVFGPVIWLMFTEDGQRRTDTMMLWLFGQQEIKMDLLTLDNRFTEQEIKQVYENLNWQCQARTTVYGDRLCVSQIGIFNGIPARYLTLFFQSGRISALKLNYRRQHHNAMKDQIQQQLGAPEMQKSRLETDTETDQVDHWNTGNGLIVLKQKLQAQEEPALFWIAANQVVR